MGLCTKHKLGLSRRQKAAPRCRSQEREDFWRVGVGDYRVVYRIEDEVLLILVVRVGDRKEMYEIIRRL